MARLTRVLIIIGQLQPGGAEVRLLQLIQAIRRSGRPLRLAVYVASGKAGQLDSAYEAEEASVIHGRPGLRGLWDVFSICRRDRIGVLHANASLAAGFYCLAAALAGVRIRLAHIRTIGYDDRSFARSIRNSFYRLFLNAFATRVIGVCDAAQAFAGSSNRKWKTIYNGIEPPPRAFAPARPKDAPLEILMLGRVREPKNPLKAIGVVLALRQSHPDLALHLHVVGRADEPIALRMKSLVRESNLDEQVLFHGIADDPYEWLRRSSVLFLPSIREGLPGVILEALACGVPVVASDLPGVREIAQRVPGIRMLPPGAPDEQWATALVDAARQASRDEIAAAFALSPFMLEGHVDAIYRLWSGQRPPAETPAPAEAAA